VVVTTAKPRERAYPYRRRSSLKDLALLWWQ
jgi:hypothetical protein